MPFYKFRCKKCKNEFEDLFNLVDGKYKHAESEKIIGPEPPEKWPCPACNSKATQRLWFDPNNIPAAVVKGITEKAIRREKQFYEYGYNKQQAENFYKESIEASKERISTMGEVYKKVDCNPQELAKQGKATKIDDKRRVEKLDHTKKIQQELAKRKTPK